MIYNVNFIHFLSLLVVEYQLLTIGFGIVQYPDPQYQLIFALMVPDQGERGVTLDTSQSLLGYFSNFE